MKKSVVVIGNFDGVHLGHQALIDYAQGIASKRDLDLTIVTFEPHPRLFFQKGGEPFRITPASMKAELLKDRCDHYRALDFNAEMVARSADEFVRGVLIDLCRAQIVIVGADFQFGKGREGTLETLQSYSEFETIGFDLKHIGGEIISSTRIRAHLKHAEMEQANTLLGREWAIEAEVIHGDKRGREIGYPTANMGFGDAIVPSYGVYAVRVQVENDDQWHRGAANIGVRPMFERETPLVETFIFDFDEDLYGKFLTVQPVQKMRDEMNFGDLDALKSQIEKDCIIAKKILHNA